MMGLCPFQASLRTWDLESDAEQELPAGGRPIDPDDQAFQTQEIRRFVPRSATAGRSA